MNANETYLMSFTTGGLFLQESLLFADLFLETNDWLIVSKKVKENNLLQSRMSSSAQRVSQEIVGRLKCLNETELNFLLKGSNLDQRLILWVAVCRKYTFIRDFAIEVLCFKYRTYKTKIDKDDYELFYSQKEDTHPEVEKLAPSTKDKLRSVMFKNMRDVGLIDKAGTINAILPTREFIYLMRTESPEDLMIFPIPDSFGGSR